MGQNGTRNRNHLALPTDQLAMDKLHRNNRLSRSLSLVGLLAFGFNIMIGSGIFFLPGEAMKILGPAALLAVGRRFRVGGAHRSVPGRVEQPIRSYCAVLCSMRRRPWGPAVGFGVGWLGYLSRVASNAGLDGPWCSPTLLYQLLQAWWARNTG